MKVELVKFKDMDLHGGTVINGFPSVGLISSITAEYLVESFKLDQIAALDSPDFPPVSMIYARKPKLPARIYADEKLKIAVFLSEFTPPPRLARPIANLIFSWARENGCSGIISPEGIPVKKEEREHETLVYGVGSNDHIRDELEKLGIGQLEIGIISGVSAVLLNEGRKSGFDVICLLTKAHPKIPDAEAAARVIETIDKLIPNIKIDIEPLYEHAKRVEKYLRNLRTQAKPAEPELPAAMYG